MAPEADLAHAKHARPPSGDRTRRRAGKQECNSLHGSKERPAECYKIDMAQTSFGDTTINTGGDLPAVGSAAPAFTLTGGDLSPVTLEGLAGRNVVLNIFPSIDTGVCANSVRAFNERAAGFDNTTVICASMDLPFAGSRFCGAEGIENVTIGSIFRNREFLSDYGVEMVDGPLSGLTARAVVVIAPDGTVAHSELVEAIASEPDYDAALAACA